MGFIIFFASLLTDLKESGKIKKFVPGVLWPLILVGIPMAIIYVFQNHFSAAFIIGSVTLIQMLIAGVRLIHLVLLGAIALPFVGYYIGAKSGSENGSFRMTRVQTWLNPWNDITGEGWQIIQSLYAIGSGGLFGAGLRSKQTEIFVFTRTTK